MTKGRDFASAGRLSPQGTCAATTIYFDPPPPFDARSNGEDCSNNTIRYLSSNQKPANKHNNLLIQNSGQSIRADFYSLLHDSTTLQNHHH